MAELREYTFRSKMGGIIRYTESYPRGEQIAAQQYMLLYVYSGASTAEVDGIRLHLQEGDLLALSALQGLRLQEEDDNKGFRYACLFFDANFYCIFANDHEVSCRGLLFGGTSLIPHFSATSEERRQIEQLLSDLKREFGVQDRYQEESLRSYLKCYILMATRAIHAREHRAMASEEDEESVRQFVNLVDEHFLRLKQVKDYAKMLHISPKTLSARVASSGRGTPLKIIHERIYAEGIRRLLYTDWSVKEIAYYLGFDDSASFSRFFRRQSGKSITEYRRSIDE